jgi:hypothetical protein
MPRISDRIIRLFYIRYPAEYRIWLAGYPDTENSRISGQIVEIPVTISIHKISKNVFLKLLLLWCKKCYFLSTKKEPLQYIWSLILFHILLDILIMSLKSGRMFGIWPAPDIRYPGFRLAGYPVHPEYKHSLPKRYIYFQTAFARKKFKKMIYDSLPNAFC